MGDREGVTSSDICSRQGSCLPSPFLEAKTQYKRQYLSIYILLLVWIINQVILILMLKYYIFIYTILIMLTQIGSEFNSIVINSRYSIFTPFMAHCAYRMEQLRTLPDTTHKIPHFYRVQVEYLPSLHYMLCILPKDILYTVIKWNATNANTQTTIYREKKTC